MTPVCWTWLDHLELIAWVIWIIRRAATLVYFSSDAMLAGLWQYVQPSAGGAIHCEMLAIRWSKRSLLTAPRTLTF